MDEISIFFLTSAALFRSKPPKLFLQFFLVWHMVEFVYLLARKDKNSAVIYFFQHEFLRFLMTFCLHFNVTQNRWLWNSSRILSEKQLTSPDEWCQILELNGEKPTSKRCDMNSWENMNCYRSISCTILFKIITFVW